MITILKKESGVDGSAVLELTGLSTDTKPTGKLNGSKFTEMDTGDVYLYDEDAEAGAEWVEQPASGGGGGGATNLNGLSDVTLSSPSNGQVLKYDGTAHKWKNADETDTDELEELTDVNLSSPTDGQVLKYNGTSGKWENANDAAGVDELEELTDVNISTPSNGQVLKYDSTSGKWENADDTDTDELEELTDVLISTPSNGQVLKYDSASGKWQNGNVAAGVDELEELTDVNISTPSNGQVLKYDSTSGKWKNANESGGSGGSADLNGIINDFGSFAPAVNDYLRPGVSIRNNTFRGKNLTSVGLAAYKNTIESGEFDDLFIGDYFKTYYTPAGYQTQEPIYLNIAHFDYQEIYSHNGWSTRQKKHSIAFITQPIGMPRKQGAFTAAYGGAQYTHTGGFGEYVQNNIAAIETAVKTYINNADLGYHDPVDYMGSEDNAESYVFGGAYDSSGNPTAIVGVPYIMQPLSIDQYIGRIPRSGRGTFNNITMPAGMNSMNCSELTEEIYTGKEQLAIFKNPIGLGNMLQLFGGDPVSSSYALWPLFTRTQAEYSATDAGQKFFTFFPCTHGLALPPSVNIETPTDGESQMNSIYVQLIIFVG